MDWLGGWLKNIIIVVMFAAFVDLILPGKKMQRYARLVLSMLILLALLRPVVSLLTEPPENKLAAELKALEEGGAVPVEAGLESILAQADKISHLQQEQSLKWAAEEIARQMKEEIAQETGERVGGVQVVLQAQAGRGARSAAIASVSVALLEKEESSERSDGRKVGVKPVDPVQVEVRVDRSAKPDEKEQKREAVEAEAELKARAAPIKELLSERWKLKNEQIEITGKEVNQRTKL